MLKLSCHLSKKLPIEGQPFSSQQFAAGLEVEVADTADPEAVRRRLRELYGLINQAVDEQLAAAGAAASREPVAASDVGNSQHRPAPQARAPRVPQDGGNGNGRARRNGQPVMATSAQKKAIGSICRDRGLDVAEVLADWNGNPERLTVKEASGVIDALKGKPAGNGHRR